MLLIMRIHDVVDDDVVSIYLPQDVTLRYHSMAPKIIYFFRLARKARNGN